jgi:hypothetical protein
VCFVRHGVLTQPAFSVRGSSRRIMTMRFRPADIRVINRRICRFFCRPFCRSSNFVNSSNLPGCTGGT